MTLQSFGSMSMSDVNVEIGNSATTTINLQDSSQQFSGADINAAPYSMDEFYSQQFSVAGNVERTIEEAYVYTTGETDLGVNYGWATDELIECVENTITAGANDYGAEVRTEQDLNLQAYGGWLNTKNVTWNGAQTLGASSFSDNQSFNGGSRFFRNNTDSKIHQIASNGTISNTISYQPPAVTLSSPSQTDTSITIRVTGDTRVTKELLFYQDDVLKATKTDHTKGDVGNTSVTYDYTYTGLSAATSYNFKVSSSNAIDGNVSSTFAQSTPGILLSTTEVIGTAVTTPQTVVISEIVTVGPFTGGSGTPKIKVNNASNTRYRQATTSGGITSASFTTPTTSASGQTLTLNGSGQVYLQFEITETTGIGTTRIYTVFDDSLSRTITAEIRVQ